MWEKRARLEGKIGNKERTVDSSKSGNGCDPVHRYTGTNLDEEKGHFLLWDRERMKAIG